MAETKKSSKYDKVAAYYERGLWSKSMVRNAVKKGWITQEECDALLGE